MKEWTRKEILFHDRAVLCWETIYTIHWIHDIWDWCLMISLWEQYNGFGIQKMTSKIQFVGIDSVEQIELRDARGYSSMLVRVKTYKCCVVVYVV